MGGQPCIGAFLRERHGMIERTFPLADVFSGHCGGGQWSVRFHVKSTLADVKELWFFFFFWWSQTFGHDVYGLWSLWGWAVVVAEVDTVLCGRRMRSAGVASD